METSVFFASRPDTDISSATTRSEQAGCFGPFLRGLFAKVGSYLVPALLC